MTDLFTPEPTENLLPYDGIVNDLGIIIDDDKPLYQRLLAELPWQSDQVTLFGKTHITRRQIVWMGDVDNASNEALSYTYSGHTRQITPWHDCVFHVKRMIEEKLDALGISVQFNSCLLNYYPSGQEGMGYHADDEPELGQQPVIASLSLGATRKFVFKHKKRPSTAADKVEIYLQSGQLVVMHGDTQQYWKHTITKTKTIADGRISLTFRRMLV